MWERSIVERSSAPMATDTHKGLRLRAAVIPPLAKALTLTHKSGRAERRKPEEAKETLSWNKNPYSRPRNGQ